MKCREIFRPLTLSPVESKRKFMANEKREWLLIFYALPARPVGNRMKIWRRMIKAGAIQLKGAVYILPATDTHYELCQWLISEVSSMGGDGAFVRVSQIETMSEQEIVALFNNARAQEYRRIEKKLDAIERKLQSAKKGSSGIGYKVIQEQIGRLTKEYDDVSSIDFFSSKEGVLLAERLKSAQQELYSMTGRPPADDSLQINIKKPDMYQHRTWATRKRPFVDRMASAWLIRKFIDRNAEFVFIDENVHTDSSSDYVTFDMTGGDFTHKGDLCTFEVLMKSFGIKDRAVKDIAEIVHELDVKDDKYSPPEAKGVEEILIGIRKTAKTDDEALERGISVFEMLYVSKS